MKDVVVQLSFHAFMQYKERVAPIEPLALEQHCQERIASGECVFRKRGFIVIDDVWWMHERRGNRVILVTCYGRTSMDLARAVGWAARMNDEIDLKNMIWVQGGEVSCSEANSEAQEVRGRIPD